MSQDNDIEQSMTAGDVGGVLADQSDVLLDTNGGEHLRETHDEQWQERESRNALKHVAGLGEIQDVTEVEYRKVRLERVVLVLLSCRPRSVSPDHARYLLSYRSPAG